MPIPALIAALGAIGSAVGASLLTSSANKSSQREQREYDYKMVQEQNAYNSPEEQVKRLRKAGLNPALAMGNGMMSAGSQESSAGGQTPPSYDFSPIAQGVSQSADLYIQRLHQKAEITKLQEESNNMAIRNRYEAQRQVLELDELLSRKNLSDSQRSYYTAMRDQTMKELGWIDKKNASQIALQESERALVDAQARKADADAAYQVIVNKYAPEQQKQITSNLQAQHEEILSAVRRNDVDAARSMAEKAVADAVGEGHEIDNQLKRDTADAYVDKIESEADEAYARA